MTVTPTLHRGGRRSPTTATRRAAIAVALIAAAAGCGDGGPGAPSATGAAPAATEPIPSTSGTSSSTTTTSSTTTSSTTTSGTTTSSTITTSASSSTTVPPVLLPEAEVPLRLAWIGGSEVELRDASLPIAAATAHPRIAGREIEYRTIVAVAPDPARTRGWVEQAVADGADALIVSLNVSWLFGRTCEGVAPAHARYACLLAPVDEATAERQAAPVRELLAAIVRTRIPTVAVVIPHSTDALENPALADLIADAEATLTALDPGAANLLVIGGVTAGRDGFREGDGFYNVVHPTPLGASRLVDVIVPIVEEFWAAIGIGR